MEEVLQKHAASGKFTGSVLVAKRDAVIFDRSHGYANKEWSIPNSGDTRFRIGSVIPTSFNN